MSFRARHHNISGIRRVSNTLCVLLDPFKRRLIRFGNTFGMRLAGSWADFSVPWQGGDFLRTSPKFYLLWRSSECRSWASKVPFSQGLYFFDAVCLCGRLRMSSELLRMATPPTFRGADGEVLAFDLLSQNWLCPPGI